MFVSNQVRPKRFTPKVLNHIAQVVSELYITAWHS